MKGYKLPVVAGHKAPYRRLRAIIAANSVNDGPKETMKTGPPGGGPVAGSSSRRADRIGRPVTFPHKETRHEESRD
jgi:hypothetical protein